MARPVRENAQRDHPSLRSHGGFTNEFGRYWFSRAAGNSAALGRDDTGPGPLRHKAASLPPASTSADMTSRNITLVGQRSYRTCPGAAQHETQRVVCKFSVRQAARPALPCAALPLLARMPVPSQCLGMLRCWAASQVACNIAFRIAAAPTSWRWPGRLCILLPHRLRLRPAPGRRHLTRHPVPHFRPAPEQTRSNAPVS